MTWTKAIDTIYNKRLGIRTQELEQATTNTLLMQIVVIWLLFF